MISAEKAIECIVANVQPLGTTTLSLRRAVHRVLAENVVASENIPPFDNSGMDGFAIRDDDVRTVPASLRIVGEIPAGENPAKGIAPGEALRIMTGAKIPGGCTAVVQQEWTEIINQEEIKILRSVQRGSNIRRAGSDVERGATVLSAGMRLRSQEIGILASLGKEFVEVFRMPAIAVLTTGSEIVDIHDKIPEGKIRNSNRYVFSALIAETGCELRTIAHADDNEADLRNKLREGMRADILITSGGVSVGQYDLVPKLITELGVEILFSKVNIRPGMPMIFGKCGSTVLFGLPGNPVSGMVTFMEFVRPAIFRMMGTTSVGKKYTLRAKMGHRITTKDGKRNFLRGILEDQNGVLTVRTTGSQISNILTSLSKANCLIIIPENVDEVNPGEDVEVELLI